MAKSKGLANVIWGLPWIAKLLLAIFLDIVYGVCRFVDGIMEKSILKVILGFLWIFYGLGIGWIIDIVCVALNIRPFFF